MDNKINIEFNGKVFALTEDEIEAAYRYQKHQYLLEDAERQLNTLVFGTDDGSTFDGPDDDQAKDDFVEEYGIGYDEACSKPMLEAYVAQYLDDQDCNISVDENTQWQNAIQTVLENHQ